MWGRPKNESGMTATVSNTSFKTSESVNAGKHLHHRHDFFQLPYIKESAKVDIAYTIVVLEVS